MSYTISDYTKRKAKKLNLTVKKSKRKNKKIDVYNKNNKKIASVGAKGYNDYPSYIKSHSLKYANKRRELYYKRHAKNNKLSGRLAKALLW